MLADVICNLKMTSFMVLDNVTSFLRMKDVTNINKRMQHSPTIGGNFQCNSGKLKEADNYKCVFVV